MLNNTRQFLREWRLEIVAFITGFVILAFELTAARIVAPYLGSTIYVWTSIIGVILAALAFGYIIGGLLADKRKHQSDIIILLLLAAVSIAILAVVKDWAVGAISEIPAPLQVQAFLASLLLFSIPTILAGAVMPYLARLNITEIQSSGQKLSRIDAAGTIGSLAGTFLTGYFLFGVIGSRNLLAVLALSLVFATIFLGKWNLNPVRLVVVLIVACSLFFSSKPALSGYLSEIDTHYSRVVVRTLDYRGRDVRALQTDGQSLQSGIYEDGDKSLVFDYTQAFANVADLNSDAQKYLIVGGGAFTFPEYLATKNPDSQVDTIEIDDKLTKLSKESFNFVQPSNLKIINIDGRQYLNQTNGSYDFIFLDAFNSIVPPFQLLTTQAVKQIDANLASDGVVVANFIATAPQYDKASLIESAYATFKTKFHFVDVYRVTPGLPSSVTQNLMLVASHRDISTKLSEVALNRSDFSEVLDTKLGLHVDSSTVLTDDYAPIERLVL